MIRKVDSGEKTFHTTSGSESNPYDRIKRESGGRYVGCRLKFSICVGCG